MDFGLLLGRVSLRARYWDLSHYNWDHNSCPIPDPCLPFKQGSGLFCLGRVLLKRNKILVLVEATASIDSAIDAILQRVIRQEFAECTVITVAHRVPTVIDSDMVMVLSYGTLLLLLLLFGYKLWYISWFLFSFFPSLDMLLLYSSLLIMFFPGLYRETGGV